MKLIAFISQKGGVGKSTLARALVVETVRKGLKVLFKKFLFRKEKAFKGQKGAYFLILN